MEDIKSLQDVSIQPKRFRLFALDSAHKEELAEKIISLSTLDGLYRLQLGLSVVIATLGLLIDSSPVVIGAMLIAPILQPIQSFAFSIATGNRSLYGRSLHNLFFTVVFGILVSILLAYLVPFVDLTDEIVSRTLPTFVDLLIALAAGVIAMLALGYKRLSDTLAGVAMAASLLPPLGVVGIGIRLLHWEVVKGSLLLFLGNLIALVLVGVVIFLIFGFVARDQKSKTLSRTRIILILITIGMIAYPLWTSMHTIAQGYRMENAIRGTVDEYLSDIDPAISIDRTEYIRQGRVLYVDLGLQVPEGVLITNDIVNNLSRRLTQRLEQSVLVDTNIVYVSDVYIPPVIKDTKPLDEEITIRNHLAILFPDAQINQLSVGDQGSGKDLRVSIGMLSPENGSGFEQRLFYRHKVLQRYLDRSVTMIVDVQYVDIFLFDGGL